MSINNRYDFVLLFDVKDGNPNGDPDGGNTPRVDSETGCGLITDVCLKRKVRNYIGLKMEGNPKPPYEIYVKEKAILNHQHERAHKALDEGLFSEADEGPRNKVDKARDWMCQNFYDIRTFGAVMSTGDKDKRCGQVRGPVQLTFARSISPIFPIEHSITRMAVTTEKEAKEQDGDNRTMGRKHTVSYGLYRAHGFISAALAKQTGFSEEDLDLFWEALLQMFEHDHSAARGHMSTRGLYVFKHGSQLGNAPAHKLFDRISIAQKNEVQSVRQFEDYNIQINDTELPLGVELLRM